MRIKFSLLTFLFCQFLFCQNKDIDTIKVLNLYLSKELNHAFQDFNKYEIKSGIKFFKKNYDKSNDSIFFRDFVIKKVDEIHLKGFVLYKINVKKIVTNINNEKYNFKGDFHSEEWLTSNGNLLIGYSDTTIFILSGSIHNSVYSDYFKFDCMQPESFYDFLKVKLFSFDIKEIKYEKQNKEWIYFSGIQIIFAKPEKVNFKIKKDFPDLVIHLGRKINCRYKNSEKIKIY